MLSQVKPWKWLIVRNIPWASDLSGNVWTKNFDSRHSSPPCHRLGCKYFFDSFAHLGWYHCTCLWPCFSSSWAVKCDIWLKQQTLISFGEGKLHKPTKKLFQSLTTISVSQSLYRDFSAKKIPKKQKTWWNEWSQKLVINHKPAPLSVKTLLCESNDKCCEQSRHYANIADGSQAFYKYTCMKEQHQSPRITTENLALGGLYCFYCRTKHPTSNKNVRCYFLLKNKGKKVTGLRTITRRSHFHYVFFSNWKQNNVNLAATFTTWHSLL